MAGLGRQALDATRGQVYPDAAAGRADATEAADDLVLSTLERGKCFGTVQGSYHVLFERLTGGRRGPNPMVGRRPVRLNVGLCASCCIP